MGIKAEKDCYIDNIRSSCRMKVFLIFGLFLSVVGALPHQDRQSVSAPRGGNFGGGGRCGSTQLTDCSIHLAAYIAFCQWKHFPPNWPKIVPCVKNAIGEANKCFPCVCEAVEWTCKCDVC